MMKHRFSSNPIACASSPNRRVVFLLLLATLLMVGVVAPAYPRQIDSNSASNKAYRKAAKKAQKGMRKYQKQQKKAMKKAAKAQKKMLKRQRRNSMHY